MQWKSSKWRLREKQQELTKKWKNSKLVALQSAIRRYSSSDVYVHICMCLTYKLPYCMLLMRHVPNIIPSPPSPPPQPHTASVTLHLTIKTTDFHKWGEARSFLQGVSHNFSHLSEQMVHLSNTITVKTYTAPMSCDTVQKNSAL